MKKIIIIGAGIAGMTAGIYGRLSGLDTEIYEMHSIPGGECTGWNRGEYHFDGCIHWLMGCNPKTKLNGMWHDTGVLDESTGVFNHEYFYRVEENGRFLNMYSDINRLEGHLLELSPEDEVMIRETCKAVRAFRVMEMPVDRPMDMMTKMDIVKMIFKMLPVMSQMKKYDSMSIDEFSSKFRHPLIRRAFSSVVPGKYRTTSLLVTLASLDTGDSAWPMGGSLAVSKRMEKRYLSLGGKIFYKARVDKVLVRDGKAAGIKLTDGREVYGDYVISAADGYSTLFDMLDGKYLDEKLKTLYTDRETYPIYTAVQVSVGVACDLSNQPHALYFKPSRAIDTGGSIHEIMPMRHFCYDPAMAPEGKSVITSMMAADFDWWKEKYADPEAYRREKERIAEEVCAAIEERFPEVRGKIEKVDVATPMTYVRYCSAWRGAWMSWMGTPKASVRYLPGNLPGLSGFYMAGQWTLPPGGLPGAALAGRWVIHRICKAEGLEFKTS